ncbi:MAG: hypothetical protein CM1200mP14_10110 [Gammaproteobacteria bacterium]|nr:MAG: hypothetical protein CM1200mP14_10110 [Gammaproteobacteria bacterium]
MRIAVLMGGVSDEREVSLFIRGPGRERSP